MMSIVRIVVALMSCFGSVDDAAVKPLLTIDDFEDAKKSKEKWFDGSAVKQKPEIAFGEGRAAGTHGMKIVFKKNESGGTSVAYYLDEKENWPAEGKVLTFWVKADQKKNIRIKVNELRGGAHSTFEGYSVEVEATTEWKEVKVELSTFTYLWGHGGGNKKLDPERIGMVAFEQIDVREPVTLFVDDVAVIKK